MVKQVKYKCKNANVYFRCMPMVNITWNYMKLVNDKKTVYVRCLQDFLMGNNDPIPNYWCFQTDGIFYNDPQKEIYEAIVPEVLHKFLDGANVAIIAYGATGTGKSMTISGTDNAYIDRGFITRALEDLVRLRDERKEKVKITYTISFVEVTNIRVYDLLDPNVPEYDGSSIKNLKQSTVLNLQGALAELFKGEGRRKMIKDAPYNSHALHSVLTITANCRLINEAKPLAIVSKLHFVDLAGVDTIGNSSCFYKSVLEIGMANVTKSQIEQLVLTLIDNVTSQILVKLKLNMLIQYLGKALNHSSLQRFIGHIRTEKEDLMMSLSMLRLGNLIRGLKGKKTESQYKGSTEGQINVLQETVNSMRQELEIQAMILNTSLAKNLTQDRLIHLQQLAENYLSNKINELTVVSFSDVNTILRVFKDRFLELEAKKKEEVDAVYQVAYERAMEALKNSSRTSVSRKPSVKSKESFAQSQTSRPSRRSLSFKGSQGGTEDKEKRRRGSKDAKKSSSASLSDHRSKTGSKIIKKLLKRKTSVASETKDETSETVEHPLPYDLPEYEQAWNEFVANENYGYAKSKSQLENDEQQAKNLNVQYLNAIRNVQDLKNGLSAKKEALKLAQLGREYVGLLSKIDDDNRNEKISSAEAEYENIIKETEFDVVKQQEDVLLLQSELRLQLEVCKRTRELINESFDRFCSDNYKTLLPNVQEKLNDQVEETVQVTKLETEPEEERTKDSNDCYNNIMKYETLKGIMQKERIRMNRRGLQKKKWVRSCKP